MEGGRGSFSFWISKEAVPTSGDDCRVLQAPPESWQEVTGRRAEGWDVEWGTRAAREEAAGLKASPRHPGVGGKANAENGLSSERPR